MRILVTGVAKAGKSTVLRVLSEMNYTTVNASDLLINSGCVKWNNEYQSYDITDVDCAASVVNSAILKCSWSCAIESVAYQLIDPSHIDLVIVVRRNPMELFEEYNRLRWPCVKMFNNMVSEVTGSHVSEIYSLFNNKVRQLIFTQNIGELRDKVRRLVGGGLDETVDWLLSSDEEKLHSILMYLERCISN